MLDLVTLLLCFFVLLILNYDINAK
ncbi:flagellar motor protein MotB [Proteiniborus ethanoligenes]